MPTAAKVIGVDEAGKGDFFGPLVIAGLLCSEKDQVKLTEKGVRDSKLIAVNKLLGIDEQLRALYPHFVLIISPAEYNQLYKKIKNLNKLLANGHAQVIEKLAKEHRADTAIIDQFGKPELVQNALEQRSVDIDLLQYVRGERHVPVAAASILARAAFIRAIDQLSEKYDYDIPRGASALVDEAARGIVMKFGEKSLPQLVKIHFKNYRRVLSPTLFQK